MNEIPPISNFTIVKTIDFSRQIYNVIPADYDSTTVEQQLFCKKLNIVIEDYNKSLIDNNMTLYKSLKHPSLVPFYGACQADGELCSLTKLMNKIDDFSALDDTQRFIIIYSLASALLYLQQNGILNKNLINLNKIVFDDDNMPKLNGFYFSEQIDINYDKSFLIPEEAYSPDTYCYKTLSYIFGSFAYVLMTKECKVPEIDYNLQFPPNFPEKYIEMINGCRNSDANSRPSMSDIVLLFVKNDDLLFETIDKEKFRAFTLSLKEFEPQPLPKKTVTFAAQSPAVPPIFTNDQQLNEQNHDSLNGNEIGNENGIGNESHEMNQRLKDNESIVDVQLDVSRPGTSKTNYNNDDNKDTSDSDSYSLSTDPVSDSEETQPIAPDEDILNQGSDFNQVPMFDAAAAATIGSRLANLPPDTPTSGKYENPVLSPSSAYYPPPYQQQYPQQQYPQQQQNYGYNYYDNNNAYECPLTGRDYTNEPRNSIENPYRTEIISFMALSADHSIKPIDIQRLNLNMNCAPNISNDQEKTENENENDVYLNDLRIEDVAFKAKNEGSSDAMLLYGKMFYNGLKVKQDFHKAAYYYKQSGKRGNGEAENLYADLLERGVSGVPQNLSKAANHYHRSARIGHKWGILNYARVLDKGIGTPISRKGATSYYRILAEGHHDTLGMYFYGLALAKGRGLPCANPEMGASFIKMAADMRMSEAMTLYGHMLMHGIGTPKNPKSGISYIFGAAEQGYPPAQNLYAQEALLGRNTEKNDQAAKMYFEKAAAQGNPDAINNIGRMIELGIGSRPDYKLAVSYYTKAAEMGNIPALLNLGNMYLVGNGVRSEPKKAALVFKFVADAGNTTGMMYYASCLENGNGVKKNKKEAAVIYKKAADMKCVSGIYHYGRCLYYGIGIKKNRTEASVYLKDAATKGSSRARKLIKTKKHK